MDPRAVALMEKYAYAKGDLLLKRRARTRFVEPEVFAGWALERSAGNPLHAIQIITQFPMPRGQRREVLDVLRPLTVVYDLTKGSGAR